MAAGIPAGEQIADVSAQFVSAASLRLRSDWFIKLRWGAGIGVVAVSAGAALIVGFDLDLRLLIGCGLLLLLLNGLYFIRNRKVAPDDIRAELTLVKLQMVVDLVLLTAVLHYSGGVENPFQFSYMIHVIIASLLFKGREIFQIAWLAILLFTTMVVGEHVGWLEHHHLGSHSDLTHGLPYLVMSLGSVWTVLLTSAYVGSRIMIHNRSIKDELVERQQDLVNAGKAQLDFFRFVTHEVKSPIVTAQSAVEAGRELAGGDLSSVSAGMFERAVRRLNQALEIVKDLADLTRGSMSGARRLEQIDLAELVRRVVARHAQAAEARSVAVSVDAPALPAVLASDESMLEKVVDNLVSNAVRYNRDGGALAAVVEDRGRRWRLTVADQGVGITADDLEHVFEEFFRSREAREITNVGTGLGLAIVKRFVESLGGTIRAESEHGRGSRFVVDLPKRGPGGRRARHGA